MMLKSTKRNQPHKHKKLDGDGPDQMGMGNQNQKMQGGGSKTDAINQYSTMSNQMKN